MLNAKAELPSQPRLSKARVKVHNILIEPQFFNFVGPGRFLIL